MSSRFFPNLSTIRTPGSTRTASTTRKTRTTRRTVLTAAATLVVAVSAAACGAGSTQTGINQPTTGTGTEVFPAAQVAPLVDAMTTETIKPNAAPRLADGLVPPTNRWFSGLVFGDQPQPVFPLPLSFGLTGNGFAFGQPKVVTSAKNIAGGYLPAVSADVGAKTTKVSGYDALSVTLESTDAAGKVLGHTVIAQGSPFVSYTAAAAGTLRTGTPFTPHGDLSTADVGGVTYALTSTGKVDGGAVSLAKGQVATFFAVPDGGSADKLAALAKNPVTGGSLEYAVAKDDVSTSLTYQTAGGDTAFATMPHQRSGLAKGTACDLGSYPSVYGTMTLCSGSTLSWTSPLTEPTAQLDLSGVSGDDRKVLVDQVTRDAANLPAFPADTYFGGKALYRAAMIYRLATQLGLDGPAAEVKTKLTEVLDQWTDPAGCAERKSFCFVYDAKTHGMVGLTASFGSDEFNDHHFHYGYFLFAAGVLAADDPSLATKYAPVMNLLAADLASSASNGKFPDQRVFDAYAGHSWASGTSPFADGNNQESSSEAVTAWTGLAEWAKASGNTALQTEAVWLLSAEAASGRAYWTDFDTSDPVYSGFEHKIMPLNWGGKRDYATWFSAEPAALLGILVIPMSPASGYLGGDPERISANVAEATGGMFDQKFGDYLLMYSGLAGADAQKAALAKAEKLDAQWIDDGNSRSYLLAWLMAKH